MPNTDAETIETPLMYLIDCNEKTLSSTAGVKLSSTVAWHFVSALYLQALKAPHNGGELSTTGLAAYPYFSRYNANALRATVARAISSIEKYAAIITYTKKSTGPWRLQSPAQFTVTPTVDTLKAIIDAAPDSRNRLHFCHEQALYEFSRHIIDGDCLLHTGNQREAALNAYYQAADTKLTVLKHTALIRLGHATIRLGQFSETVEILDRISSQQPDTYVSTQTLLLRAKVLHLTGHEPPTPIAVDSILSPDDISVSQAMTLSAFQQRGKYLKLAEQDGDNARKSLLANNCLENLLAAMHLRVRAFYYDGAQQSAYNIANTIRVMSQQSSIPFDVTAATDVILRWGDLCKYICSKFDLGQDSNLNELLLAETLADAPGKQQQALQLAQEAHAKSMANCNEYDQQHLKQLIYRLSSR